MRARKGRIVLIGATAFGLGSTLKTPLPKAVEPVQVMAHTVASILNEDFFTLPPWANGLKWLLMLVVLGYLLFVLPRLGAGLGAGLSAVLLVAFLGVEIVLIGTGRRQRFPAPALMRPLMQARIGFEVMDLGSACRTFNILVNEGRSVAAALIFDPT